MSETNLHEPVDIMPISHSITASGLGAALDPQHPQHAIFNQSKANEFSFCLQSISIGRCASLRSRTDEKAISTAPAPFCN